MSHPLGSESGKATVSTNQSLLRAKKSDRAESFAPFSLVLKVTKNIKQPIRTALPTSYGKGDIIKNETTDKGTN